MQDGWLLSKYTSHSCIVRSDEWLKSSEKISVSCKSNIYHNINAVSVVRRILVLDHLASISSYDVRFIGIFYNGHLSGFGKIINNSTIFVNNVVKFNYICTFQCTSELSFHSVHI